MRRRTFYDIQRAPRPLDAPTQAERAAMKRFAMDALIAFIQAGIGLLVFGMLLVAIDRLH